MGYIELLERGNVLERGQVANSIRLDAEQLQLRQLTQPGERGDLVLGQPELFQVLECVKVLYLADPVGPKLQHTQLVESFQILDGTDLVGDKVEVGQLGEMIHVLDVFDLVEAQIEVDELGQLINAADVADQVVVEIQVL